MADRGSGTQSLHEPLGKLVPHVAVGFVFNAVFEIGIVVDFDDHGAVGAALEVDAVEAIADQVGGADGDVDHVRGGFGDGDGFVAAFDGLAAFLVLDDLPVASRHLVLADEERTAVKNADSPVEFGGHEFLRNAEIGVFQELRDDFAEFLH